MPSRINTAKRALRLITHGAGVHALLEINAAVEEYKDDWLLLCIRGRIFAGLRRYAPAISDYVQVLGGPNSLSQRNKLGLLHSIMVYATALSNTEKGDLSEILRNQLGLPEYNKHLVHWDQWHWVASSRVGKHRVTSAPYQTGEKRFEPITGGRITNIGRFLLDSKDIERLNTLVARLDKGDKKILTTYPRNSD